MNLWEGNKEKTMRDTMNDLWHEFLEMCRKSKADTQQDKSIIKDA